MLRVRLNKKKKNHAAGDVVKMLPTTIVSHTDNDEREDCEYPLGPRGGMCERSSSNLSSSARVPVQATPSFSQQHLAIGSSSQSPRSVGISRVHSYGGSTVFETATTHRGSSSESEPSGSSDDGAGEDAPVEGLPQQDFKFQSVVDAVIKKHTHDRDGEASTRKTRAGGAGGVVVEFPRVQSNIGAGGQPTTDAYTAVPGALLVSSDSTVTLVHPFTFAAKEIRSPDGKVNLSIDKVLFVTEQERARLLKDAAGLRARRRRNAKGAGADDESQRTRKRILYVAPATDGDTPSSSSSDSVSDQDAPREVDRALVVRPRSPIRNNDAQHVEQLAQRSEAKGKPSGVNARLAATLLDPDRNAREQQLRRDMQRLKVVSLDDVKRTVLTENKQLRRDERLLRTALRETIRESNHGLAHARVAGKTSAFLQKEADWRQASLRVDQQQGESTSGQGRDLQTITLDSRSLSRESVQLGHVLPSLGNSTSANHHMPQRGAASPPSTSFFFTQPPEVDDGSSSEDGSEGIAPDPSLPPIAHRLHSQTTSLSTTRRLMGPPDRSVAARNPLLSYSHRSRSIWSEANKKKYALTHKEPKEGTSNTSVTPNPTTTSREIATLGMVNKSSFQALASLSPLPRLLPLRASNPTITPPPSDKTNAVRMPSPHWEYNLGGESPFSTEGPPWSGPPTATNLSTISERVQALKMRRQCGNVQPVAHLLYLEDTRRNTAATLPLQVRRTLSSQSMEEVSGTPNGSPPIKPASQTQSGRGSKVGSMALRTTSGSSSMSGFSSLAQSPNGQLGPRRKSTHALTAFSPVLAAAMMLKRSRMNSDARGEERDGGEEEEEEEGNLGTSVRSSSLRSLSPAPVSQSRARRGTVAAGSGISTFLEVSPNNLLNPKNSTPNQSISSNVLQPAMRSVSLRTTQEQVAARMEAELLAQRQAEEHRMRDMARRFQPISAQDVFSKDRIALYDRAIAAMEKQKKRTEKRKQKRRRNSHVGMSKPNESAQPQLLSVLSIPSGGKGSSSNLLRKKSKLSITSMGGSQRDDDDRDEQTISDASDSHVDSNSGTFGPVRESSSRNLLTPKASPKSEGRQEDFVFGVKSSEDASMASESLVMDTSTPIHLGSPRTLSNPPTLKADKPIPLKAKSRSKVTSLPKRALAAAATSPKRGCRAPSGAKHRQAALDAQERIHEYLSRRTAQISSTAEELDRNFYQSRVQRLEDTIRASHAARHRFEEMQKSMQRQEALRPINAERRRDALDGFGFKTKGGGSSVDATSTLERVAQEAAHDLAEVRRLESHVARLEKVRPVLAFLRNNYRHPVAQEICLQAEAIVSDETLFYSHEEERAAQRRAEQAAATHGAGQQSIGAPAIVATVAEAPRDPVEAQAATIQSIALARGSKTNKSVFLERLVPLANPHDLLSDDCLSALTYCGMIFSATPAEVATVALQRAYDLVADHGAILERTVLELA